MSELTTTNPIASMNILDPYEESGVAKPQTHANALGTISAGYLANKNGKTYPQRSSDGTIYIAGDDAAKARVPGLAQALKHEGGKKLTIAFLSNNPHDYIQQRFAKYGSPYRIYGDEKSLTVIDKTKKTLETFHAGTPEYKRWLKECNPQYNIYFVLATWGENGEPSILMPDGFGYYRLRTNSRQSMNNIMSSLYSLYAITNNHIAGVPLTLQIVYRESTDQHGVNRTVPVWSLVMQPPGGMMLTNHNFAQLTSGGFQAVQNMQHALPAPEIETIDAFVAEVEVEDGDSDIAERVKAFEDMVAETVLENNFEGVLRQAGYDSSLATLARNLPPQGWQELLEHVQKQLETSFFKRHSKVIVELGFKGKADSQRFLAFLGYLLTTELESLDDVTLEQQRVLETIFQNKDNVMGIVNAWEEKYAAQVAAETPQEAAPTQPKSPYDRIAHALKLAGFKEKDFEKVVRKITQQPSLELSAITDNHAAAVEAAVDTVGAGLAEWRTGYDVRIKPIPPIDEDEAVEIDDVEEATAQ
jgi:hypothetical protein